MKNIIRFVILVTLFAAGSVHAQFKDTDIIKPGVKSFIVDEGDSFLFGLFDPSKFSMNHSYSMSYSTFGGNGLALGVYTNSMMYRFSDNMELQVDANLVHSPYSSFGDNFTNSITGIHLSSARLNYRPWKNFSVSLSYQQLPGLYNSYGYGYNSFYNNSFFNSGWGSGFPSGE